MINARRALERITLLSLVAINLLGGCRFFSAEQVPLAYTRVTTIRPHDLGEPFGIAVRDDVIYISDGEAGTILRIDADGNAATIASGLRTPSAIAFLPDGSLAVADTGSHTIKKISTDGSVAILAGIDSQRGSTDGPAHGAMFNAPIGIAVADDGSVYVSDTYNDRIRVISDGVVSTVAGGDRGYADGISSGARFDTPLGIAVWGDRLLIADSGNARIRFLEKSGVVGTLAGSDIRELTDGPLSGASFVMPSAISVDERGQIFVADGNAIRVIGRRLFPWVETLAGNRRGFVDGEAMRSQFDRPSGIAVDTRGRVIIADSDNRAVRVLSDSVEEPGPLPSRPDEEQIRLADRWPFDPPSNPREVAGTLGEIRGEVKPDGKPVWFHNGLDIAGAYGETTRFLRNETVLDPHAAENFGTARELLRMPLIGYIHLRLGRYKDDQQFGDTRFQFERDTAGKPVALRVPRGASFKAGEMLGTLNSMNHVHLIAGRLGKEVNALGVLELPGVRDSITPVIEEVGLFTVDWTKVGPRDRLAEKVRVVVRAYDRMDGNAERRRLGVYRIGHQLLSGGSALGEVEWRIRFDRTPSSDAVRLAYAEGSRSGYTADTVFNYIATNHVDGERATEGFIDTTDLAPGKYVLRVFAADYFGNVATKDVEVVK